jgi:nucleotide-binding universal stress UspA family protein
MISRILVPTDFSVQSDAALAYARLFGKTFNASLHLMHVSAARLRPPHGGTDLPEALPAALRQLRDRVTRDGGSKYTTIRLVEGKDPAGHITAYAQSAHIALIVLGTHGRNGIARLVMGSVAETVVRTAPCPVVTVHGATRSSVVGVRRILVPTDFSAASGAALDAANVLAARFGASLHLLHVLTENCVKSGMGSEIFAAEAPAVRRLRLMNARDRLTHRIPTDRRPSNVTTEVLFGAPAETIAAYASDNHFDLIVMGTQGRTGKARVLMGSVAERVVRTAHCPVMTTRTAWSQAESLLPAGDVVEAIA